MAKTGANGRELITKELMEILIEKLNSTYKIAELLGYSQTNIRHYLKKFGLKSKGRKPEPISFNWDVNNVRILAMESSSMTELVKKLGLRNSGNQYKNFKIWIEKNGIDVGKILRKTYRDSDYTQANIQPPVINKNTNLIGNISTLEVSSLFMRLGYIVYSPVGEGCRTDLIVENKDGKLFRIQVKTVLKDSEKDAIRISTRNSSKYGPTNYFNEVDHIVAYDRRDGNVYAVTPILDRASVTLRKKRPTLNVNYLDASDFLLFKIYPSQWTNKGDI